MFPSSARQFLVEKEVVSDSSVYLDLGADEIRFDFTHISNETNLS